MYRKLSVFLCGSQRTSAASALTGILTQRYAESRREYPETFLPARRLKLIIDDLRRFQIKHTDQKGVLVYV